MKLHRLSISSFKGVEQFDLVLDGKNATVYGPNGAGKSSLVDAFLWMLTGSDAAGNAVFNIKPLDQNGLIVRGNKLVECSVEGLFSRNDGTTFTLKRMLSESWVKKRGYEEAEYKGDETKTWVDGVPYKIGEFKTFIESNFSIDRVVRVLTSTSYFNSQIDWKERRNILFAVFGDMTDDEVFSADKELEPLSSRLEGRSVEQFQKMMKAQLSETVDELERLHVRIDEADKSICTDSQDIDKAAAENIISKSKVELAQLRRKLEQRPKEDVKLKLHGDLMAAQMELGKENSLWSDFLANENREYERTFNTAVDAAIDEYRKFERIEDDWRGSLQHVQSKISLMEKERISLRASWEALVDNKNKHDSMTFVCDETCPTCNQPFPPEALEEMRGNWNQKHSQKSTAMQKQLDDIVTRGKALAADIEKLKSDAAELEEVIGRQTGETVSARKAIEDIRTAHTPYQPPTERLEIHNARVNALQQQITELEAKIAAAGTEQAVDTEIAGIQQRMDELDNLVSESQKVIAQAEVAESARNRIAEYSARQKELGGIRDSCESMIHICEKFVRSKVNKITDRINNHFKIVRFKLFEEQKNGGLKEICDATVDGVPYESMNRARQMAACLDIINAFGKQLELDFPVFIDNAEGIYEDYGVSLGDTQQIRLYATEDDSGLRVEVMS